jgi:Flp pilus assembly pilin Flp
MNILKRLWQEDDGQGLTEYTLAMVLVALGIWLGVKIPALEIA